MYLLHLPTDKVSKKHKIPGRPKQYVVGGHGLLIFSCDKYTSQRPKTLKEFKEPPVIPVITHSDDNKEVMIHVDNTVSLLYIWI